ncbi:accessory Sec system S-layer assembly protein [Psychrobacillus sp. NPDC093180]|uniref:accessory Sec system S-layer assembly protein n=1 Tax=Psychrobacillus sp. NPDC093180 TaxID=3364489 RepID=UPI00382B59AC
MAFFQKKKQENEEEKLETAMITDTVNQDAVPTTLEFHPLQQYSTPQTYVLKYHHEQLPTLKLNQISISGIRLTQTGEKLEIEAFIRNTVDQPIKFSTLDLVLLDEVGKTLANKSFNMEEVGTLSALSSMPWVFTFEKENILVDDIPNEGWKIAFAIQQVPKEHSLDLEPSWENHLSQMQRKRIEELVTSLPKLGETEVSLMILDVKLKENGDVIASALIRNGKMEAINVKDFSLIVMDATNEQICSRNFILEDFIVKGNATKPWTFKFPEQLVQKKNPDFSKWKVQILKNK